METGALTQRRVRRAVMTGQRWAAAGQFAACLQQSLFCVFVIVGMLEEISEVHFQTDACFHGV